MTRTCRVIILTLSGAGAIFSAVAIFDGSLDPAREDENGKSPLSPSKAAASTNRRDLPLEMDDRSDVSTERARASEVTAANSPAVTLRATANSGRRTADHTFIPQNATNASLSTAGGAYGSPTSFSAPAPTAPQATDADLTLATTLQNFHLMRDADGWDITFDARAAVPIIFTPSTEDQQGSPGSVAGNLALPTEAISAKGGGDVEARIIEDFTAAVDPETLTRQPTIEEWQEAASLADERYQVFLGDVAFMAASREAGRRFQEASAE